MLIELDGFLLSMSHRWLHAILCRRALFDTLIRLNRWKPWHNFLPHEKRKMLFFGFLWSVSISLPRSFTMAPALCHWTRPTLDDKVNILSRYLRVEMATLERSLFKFDIWYLILFMQEILVHGYVFIFRCFKLFLHPLYLSLPRLRSSFVPYKKMRWTFYSFYLIKFKSFSA